MSPPRLSLCALFAVAFLASPAPAHKGKPHRDAAPASSSARSYARINAVYLRQVKPVFAQKCFHCHGSGKPFPWYFRLPGPRQLMLYDIRTAKKHLDMDRDFPFGGHASQLEHLEALEKVLRDGSMPPWRYRIMHPGSRLSAEEAETIRAWIDGGKPLLQDKVP